MTDAHYVRVKSSVDALPITEEKALPPELLGSWRRCIDEYGLDPRDRHETVVLDNSAITERRQSIGEIFDLLVHESRSIYSQIRDSGSSVVVCDAQGVVLSWVGDIDREMGFRKSGLMEGALWDEAHEGTNGIGTCIANKKPVLIHREDHFLERNISLCCTGMPICNANGDVLAVLDITSANPNETRSSQVYSLALLNVSARKVEQWNFRKNYAGYTLLRVNKRPELVGSFDDAMLALDDEGVILAIDNPHPLEMVGYFSKDLIGKSSSQFFNLRRPNNQVANVQVMELKHASRKDTVLFALLDLKKPTYSSHGGYTNQSSNKQREKSVKKVPTFKVNKKLLNKDAEFSRLSTTATALLKQGIPVLIVGETGSGKNYIAQVLHQHANPDGDFIEINMDKPATQITTVLEDRFSQSAQQDSGVTTPTFFMDDIGQLCTKEQASLTKAVTQIERINASIENKIKIISSSSCAWLSAHGSIGGDNFRKDLYYRLAGFIFPLSPLKSRKDKVYIFNTFLTEAAGKRQVKLDAEVIKIFKEYDWPGNYWELKNVMAAAVTQSGGEIIEKSDLPPVFQYQQMNNCAGMPPPELQTQALSSEPEDQTAPSAQARSTPHGNGDETSPTANDLRHKVKNAERALIVEALEKNFWNISQTAKQLDVSRKTLYRKMETLQIPYSKGK